MADIVSSMFDNNKKKDQPIFTENQSNSFQNSHKVKIKIKRKT